MSHSQSTPDLYRINVNTRIAERQKNRSTFPVDQELYELCNLSGVTLDSEVFQILLDLIKINVSPNVLVQVLKKMIKQGRGSVENIVAPSESGRNTASVSSKESSGGDSAFDATRNVVFRDDVSVADSEKSSSERLASRLRALKAGRKAT